MEMVSFIALNDTDNSCYNNKFHAYYDYAQ